MVNYMVMHKASSSLANTVCKCLCLCAEALDTCLLVQFSGHMMLTCVDVCLMSPLREEGAVSRNQLPLTSL